MADLDKSPALRVSERWICGGSALSALSLALQVRRPLEQLATAPDWFNWSCLAVLGLGLMLLLVRGKTDERWLSGVSLFGLFAFVGRTEPWSISKVAELTSRAAELLSTTHGGLALIALGYTWLALGIGLLSGRATSYCLFDKGPWQVATSWLLGLLVAGFGAHGVIGYASGSSSLLLP